MRLIQPSRFADLLILDLRAGAPRRSRPGISGAGPEEAGGAGPAGAMPFSGAANAPGASSGGGPKTRAAADCGGSMVPNDGRAISPAA